MALPACGGDGGGGDHSASGLSEALDSVSAGEAAQQHVGWSDLAAIREVGDLPASAADIDLSGKHVEAERAADAMRERLSLDSTLPDTRQGLDAIAADVEIDTGQSGGRSYARAVLTLRDDRPRGVLQQSAARGTFLSFIGR